ncbi:hypothetical protein SDC9_177514 [bioreactor metagenome]|uniref:Uncharacterized protein n=1 Tax=bioreactor metagenome TaxID=1076179 RepID=A0A645GTA1_9ZZZZ
MQKSLLMTRLTFPSTTGHGWPKAMEAIAAAVYGPMPGRDLRSLKVSGNRPPHSFATIAAVLRTL